MNFRKPLCAAIIAALYVSGVHADPISKDKVASGKIDDTICGIKVIGGNLKSSEAILGKGKFTGKADLTKKYVWNKESMQIEISFSKDDGAIKLVGVKGSDPAGICKTGRGLQLGQTLEEVRKLYGQFDSEEASKGGATNVIAVWSENEDLYINMSFQKNSHQLSKIEVQYMLE